MELDHQQMAGASFEKPITAAVPGIGGDSAEVTAWDFTCSKAATRGSILLVPLFGFPCIFLTPCSPRKLLCGAAYAAALARQGGAGKSERGTGAASHGSMGIGNTWHSTAQEGPPVTATLAKKHRSKFEFIAKRRDPFRGELLTSK